MNEEKIERIIRELILEIGDNPERDGLIETPKRVAKMFQEIYSGYNIAPNNILKLFPNPNHGEPILIKDIPFYSMCEHHMLPFSGIINIAYIPSDDVVIGLSKFSRIIDYFSRKLQIQENLGQEIGTYIMEKTHAKGVIVLIKAEHLCIAMRGVKKASTKATTVFADGLFCKNKALQTEYIKLLND